MTEEKVSIKNRKGQNIVAVICVPENSKGLAFTVHGLGGHMQEPHVVLMAKTLLEHNYMVVKFDATNSIGESDGKYEEATIQNHYEDLVDVIIWAKTQDWYMEPFVLAGHSLGGYAVARYAEDYSQEVKAVFPFALLVAGEFNYRDTEKFMGNAFKLWKETGWDTQISNSKPGVIKRLPWSHMEERLKHDLRPNAHKLTMPVLMVVGEEDKLCSPETQKIFYDLISGPKEIHIVSMAPHTFRQTEHLEQLKDIFNKWLFKIK